MISPQHLINTGICGLFCATLFSLAATNPATKQIAVARPVPIAQDYTLHIKPVKVQQRIYTPVLRHDVSKVRSLEQRNHEAREKRTQFEELFTRSNTRGGQSLETTTIVISRPEEPSVILLRARNAVHRGIEAGVQVNE